MMYLIAILLPPLYFLIKKKWLAFAVTGFLMFFSIFMFILIPILWPVCAICAVWDLRKAMMHEHATIIAETMRQQQPVPSVLPAPPKLPQ
jgi:hypothetical protein